MNKHSLLAYQPAFITLYSLSSVEKLLTKEVSDFLDQRILMTLIYLSECKLG